MLQLPAYSKAEVHPARMVKMLAIAVNSPTIFAAIKVTHIKKMWIYHSFIVSAKLLATADSAALLKFKVFIDHSDYCYCLNLRCCCYCS